VRCRNCRALVATGFLYARLDVVSWLSWSGGFDGAISERGCQRGVFSEGCGGGVSYQVGTVAVFSAEPGGDRAPQADDKVTRPGFVAVARGASDR
jgi:hypothetical protein